MDAMDNKQIGLRIAQARNDKNMTGKELSLRIGVAASTILRYEKGQIAKIKIPIIEAIARTLDINPMWLIGKSKHKSVKKMLAVSEENQGIEGMTSMYDNNKLSDEDQELLNLYHALDIEDRAEIRGEMKGMLRADKYKSKIKDESAG